MCDWRPAASLERLRLRARLIDQVRTFFSARGVLEVETPLLASATVTDTHLQSFEASREGRPVGYLQTSPEFAMKRLLAAGYGSVYQVCRAFRDGERGRLHLPEFTMLEWYRVGFDHHALMDEVEALLATLLGTAGSTRLTYRELFRRTLGLDPLTCDVERLRVLAEDLHVHGELDRDELLALLLTHRIEPTFVPGSVLFVHDFPASQAALARLREDRDGILVAERFEVYVGPIELANGFHELRDAAEQRRRFERDLESRRVSGLAEPPIDERLLAALVHGLPECAGVALGFDRLVMLAAGAQSVAEVTAFPDDLRPSGC
ncbi:MAG TPA: EF-P lysine aminoacylase EpmA [Thermoanaerobaculia bacterium]|nr:EF-P lysine aminoacylase EpmA [Thermoanaerobaculia bacterium]